MAADEPPYLTVGTDVSAKYKGAFCEAKVKKVNRLVKCKVTFKNNLGTGIVSDDQVRGTLRVGAHVEAKHPEKNQYLEGIINKLFDYSQYTVVFDDGDETTLRRTSLCLKSGRHFAESETLDQLPLTHPEHFGTPVMGSKSKRKRRSTIGSMSVDDDSTDEDLPMKKSKEGNMKERDPNLGKVVCIDLGDKRRKDRWFPALVVSPLAQDNIKVNTKEDFLVRSFKDGKYYQIAKKDTREFTREIGLKVDSNTLKAAVEKAQIFLDRDELPPHWDRDLLMGLNAPSAEEDSHDSDSDTSDDEPSEEKDRFVAQLYKFMDERGTPINKAPTVGNRDLNLYKLFKVVQKTGGYNRVTNHNQWRTVYIKMGLPGSNPASSHQMRLAYKKYLHSFEDFYRKLGCTMVTNTRSSRVRHRSDRNFIMTRNRDRDLSMARGRQHAKEMEKKRFEERMKDEEEEGKSRTSKLQTGIKEKSEVTEEKLKIKEETRARTREEVKREKADSPDKKESKSAVKTEPEGTVKELEEKDKGKREKKEKEEKDKKDQKDRKEERLGRDEKDDNTIKEKKDDRPCKERCENKSSKDRKDEKLTKEKRDDKMAKEKKEEKSIKEKLQRDKRDDKKDERTSKEKKEDKPLKEKKEIKPPKEEKNYKDRKDDKIVKEKLNKPEKGHKEMSKDEKLTKDKKDTKVIHEKDRKEEKATRLKIKKDDDDTGMFKKHVDDLSTLLKKQGRKKIQAGDDTSDDRAQSTDDDCRKGTNFS